jgi:hypothetical protein
MSICSVRFVFLFLLGWFCFYGVYVLLCVTWFILLIGILLDCMLDLRVLL